MSYRALFRNGLSIRMILYLALLDMLKLSYRFLGIVILVAIRYNFKSVAILLTTAES